MIALLVVLFFGVTGITLNHPDWAFGQSTSTTESTGTLEFDPSSDDGAVDYLAIAEFVRSTYGVHGEVDSYDTVNDTATIAFKGPGYSADVYVDIDSGDYSLTVVEQGFVAAMNDLHKGRDSGSVWSWVVDISAAFLVVISLTGLAMQLVLRRRRRSALAIAVVGAVVGTVLMVVTVLR